MSRPYLLSKHEKIEITPLITVPEAAPNGYRMAGVPDGIGAYRTGADTFDVLMTHEFRYNQGGRRLHAASGAFVSQWRFDLSNWREDGSGSLSLISGKDQIRCVHAWNRGRGQHREARLCPLERLCSADLPAESALFFTDEDGVEWGTHERLFLGGEETHTRYKPVSGRAFAHTVTGPDTGFSFELPRLGRGSWENVLACPKGQRKTIAILPDDATASRTMTREFELRSPTSELYVYVGAKERSDSKLRDFEKAGLHNGTLYGVQVYLESGNQAVLAEDDELGFGGPHSQEQPLNEARFRLVDLGDRSKDDPVDLPGIALQKDSLRAGVTQFLRLEDGAWDPRDGYESHFWVVSTGDVDGDREADLNTRLFHLIFDDLEHPEQGGRILIEATGRVDGKWNFRLLDSVTVDRLGRVFLQEDPDRSQVVSRTLLLGKDKVPRVVAYADPELFTEKDKDGKKHEGFITANEESAGIVPMDDILGAGWFLTAVQCNDDESWRDDMRPEGISDKKWEEMKLDLHTPGQLLLMRIPPGIEDELSTVDDFEL